MKHFEKLIFDSVSHLILANISEAEIQNSIKSAFLEHGYVDIKPQYKQAFPRVKNHSKTKPDLVLTKKGESFLFEVKLLPDKDRAAARFERAFVDCAYLKNETEQNGVRGFFVLLDLQNTGYFIEKQFVQVCMSHLNLKIITLIDWIPVNSNQNSRLFVIEILPDKNT